MHHRKDKGGKLKGKGECWKIKTHTPRNLKIIIIITRVMCVFVFLSCKKMAWIVLLNWKRKKKRKKKKCQIRVVRWEREREKRMRIPRDRMATNPKRLKSFCAFLRV